MKRSDFDPTKNTVTRRSQLILEKMRLKKMDFETVRDMFDPCFTITAIHDGLCKIVFQGFNKFGEKIFYCIMETPQSQALEGLAPGSRGYAVYRCAGRDYEPQGLAYAKVPLVELFEVPTGKSLLESEVKNFILRN